MSRYYFDHNATTPVSAEVMEAMLPAFTEAFGNASSIHHYGQIAKQRLEMARRNLAALIQCDPREIVFVSGGTEANNLAIFGSLRWLGVEGRHVITSAIEHPAVLSPCAQLEREGAEVTYLPVDSTGLLNPDDVRRALRPGTALISVMHANNETGALQPIREIASIGKEAGIPVHADGVQAVGKIPVDVASLGVDLYSISGHKLYAPKGIGALFVKKGAKVAPVMFGGHHERERRPGTENVPGAVGLGRAAAWMEDNLDDEAERLRVLRDLLEQGILERVPGAGVSCAGAPRTPNTSSIYFDGVDGESMVISLDLKGFAVSSGSACSSGAVEPSHVLSAIGLTPEQARASLRFSLGRMNTLGQVDELIEAVADSVEHLRKLSPAYTARVF